MLLSIRGASGVILELDDQSENALIPGNPAERADAFRLLTDALALLVGVAKPPLSCAATEDDLDLYSPRIEPDHDDRRPRVVVPLKAQRGD